MLQYWATAMNPFNGIERLEELRVHLHELPRIHLMELKAGLRELQAQARGIHSMELKGGYF